MVNKQQIVDYAGRKTLLGKYLLEIIFGKQFDWELLRLWKANRWYPKLSSPPEIERSIANETLVNSMVARFHPSPNIVDPEEGLVGIEFDVHEFCVWFVDRIEAIPNFTLCPSARLFVNAVHIEVAPDQSKAELPNIEEFIRGLTFYFTDPCVFAREPNKKATPYTLPSIGFKKPEGVTAQNFIEILRNPMGPYYSLGPSHSNTGAGGRNISDVGTSGEYVPEETEDGEGIDGPSDRISTGLHIIADDDAQRTEIPEYRSRKSRLIDIDKKLHNFIEKEFDMPLGADFKLYSNAPEKGHGEYRFKFQTKSCKAINTDKFQSMDKDSILMKLKILNNIGDEESVDEFMVLYTYAKKKGISDDELNKCLASL
jgi:hypothetical protein